MQTNVLCLALVVALAAALTVVPSNTLGLDFDEKTVTRRIVSSDAGDRLAVKEPLAWHAVRESSPRKFSADPTVAYQEMDGFGGSFLEAGAICLNRFSEEKQNEILDLLFSEEGAAFTVGKTPIASNDFMCAGPWYSYTPTPKSKFSIDRDLAANGTLTYIKKALARTPSHHLRLQATMDYPPDWMLNETTPLPYADINTTFYDSLAEYYMHFAQEYARHGVPIEYLSLFNEPSESYVSIQPDNIVKLLVDHVGPLFRANDGLPKLTWAELFGRFPTGELMPKVLNQPGMEEYNDIIFYHGYDCGEAGGWICDNGNCTCPGLAEAIDNIRRVHEQFPHLKMWMTEVCYATEFDDYKSPPCPPLPRVDFEDGLQWGRMLFGDLGAGASAWLYWNMVLDTTGGPWLVSPEHVDPDDNVQQPLIVVDAERNEVTPTGAYYFLAHFSKYVRPGMRRVATVTAHDWPAAVAVLSFASSDRLVMELMNDSRDELVVTVVQHGREAQVVLPPISITTLETVRQ